MKPTVYIETTVIGYLAMRPSNLLQVAAKQQVTREWWDQERGKYDLFVSRYVIEECDAGDPVAAAERRQFLTGLTLLTVSNEVTALAKKLVGKTVLPQNAAVDALHLSAAAVHGIQYLLTWNCRHIANLALQRPIENVCRREGYEPPILCTPEELLELNHGP